jgi:DNA-binding transcriptional ArsR family regulator
MLISGFNLVYYGFHLTGFIYICLTKTGKMTKIILCADELEKVASVLKAISHPVRISIINALEDGEKLTVTELHNVLGVEQSTASHHLGIMKDKGVLVSHREGKNIYYSLRDEQIKTLLNCIGNCKR